MKIRLTSNVGNLDTETGSFPELIGLIAMWLTEDVAIDGDSMALHIEVEGMRTLETELTPEHVAHLTTTAK